MAAQAGRRRRERDIEKAGEEPSVPEGLAKITPEELAKHTADDDLWIAFHGLVLDVSKWLRQHPGGNTVLKDWAGKDGTQHFDTIHGGKGPMLMITTEIPDMVKVVGEYDAPEGPVEIEGTVRKEFFNQSEEEMEYVIGGGAVDIEEEIQLGKSEVVKVTQEGPTSTLYISGHIANEKYIDDPSLKQQAAVALTSLRSELREAGAELEDIVKLTAYVKDIDRDKYIEVARAMNETCQAWGRPWDFLKDRKQQRRRGPRAPPPAWSIIGIPGLAEEKALVQFDAIAVIPGKMLAKL